MTVSQEANWVSRRVWVQPIRVERRWDSYQNQHTLRIHLRWPTYVQRVRTITTAEEATP